MTKAQTIIHLVECECACEGKHTCPKCGNSFGEDNSQHVLHGAKMDEPPYIPDDKDTSGQVSNNAGVRRKSIQDIIDIRYTQRV